MSLAGCPCLEETWRAGSSLGRGERMNQVREDAGVVSSRGPGACSPAPPVGSLGGAADPLVRTAPAAGLGPAGRDSNASVAFRGWQSDLSLGWLGGQRCCQPVEPILWLSTRVSLTLQKSSVDPQRQAQKGR